jgi:hypothetical protein
VGELKLYHCREMAVSFANYSKQNSHTDSEEQSVARRLMPWHDEFTADML